MIPFQSFYANRNQKDVHITYRLQNKQPVMNTWADPTGSRQAFIRQATCMCSVACFGFYGNKKGPCLRRPPLRLADHDGLGERGGERQRERIKRETQRKEGETDRE